MKTSCISNKSLVSTSENFRNSLSLSLSLFRIRGGALFLMVFLSMTFIQCSKNEMASPNVQGSFLEMDRKALLNDIIGKTGDIRNSNETLRSSTTYTISEAIDLLDESLNYAYCRPGTPLQNTIILSDTLVMEVNTSTQVTETMIADLFDDASLDLGNQFHALSLNNQQPWAFSVRQFDSLENNELPIIIQLSVAYGGYVNALVEYDENDDYSYEFQGGLCNATPGSGAPEILRNNLTYDHVIPPPSGKLYKHKAKYFRVCNVWLGDVIVCDGDGLPNDIFEFDWEIVNPMVKASINLWDNTNDFELFRQCECAANYDECLSGDIEMPFNESAMGDLIVSHRPSNYAAGNIYVGSKKRDDWVLNGDLIYHNMIVVYYKNVSVAPNDEVADPLPCTEC